MPSIYTVKVNGRTSLTTDVLPHLFARLHDLRTAAGPVTVEEDGRELSAVEVEELMLRYHAGREQVAPSLPECTVCGECEPIAAYGGWCCAKALKTPPPTDTPKSLLAEAKELDARAGFKERQADAVWCKSPGLLRRDAEIFREEAKAKRRRAARLAGVASY